MSPEKRSANMSKIRSKDTKPEMHLRRLLHGEGYRYRLHERKLPGRPDLVFPGRMKVIFVHGCFWHGHDCPVGARLPKSNIDYWTEKRASNQQRDAAQPAKLAEMGWETLIVWECEIRSNSAILEAVEDFLGPPTRRSGGRPEPHPAPNFS